MRVALTLSCMVLLVTATAAFAASGTVQVTLTPDTVSSASTLSVSANGPFSGMSGQPKSTELLVQKGFSTSVRSVSVLCQPSQASHNSCPARSQIGSGEAVATGTLAGVSQQDTITFKIFLGPAQRRGDIASVVLIGSDQLFHMTDHVTGRLLQPHGSGPELLFNQLPNVSVPAGTQVTLDSLSFTAGATRTVVVGSGRHRHRVRYSLIRNPPRCTGHWTSVFRVTFSTGTLTRTLSARCRRAT